MIFTDRFSNATKFLTAIDIETSIIRYDIQRIGGYLIFFLEKIPRGTNRTYRGIR